MVPFIIAAVLQGSVGSAPVIHADRSVTWTFAAHAAKEVRLWGDWQPGESGEPMRRTGDGGWATTTGPLSPGPHLYAFIVDGLRVADPENRRIKNGFPGISSIVEVPDPALADLPAGVTHVHTFRHPESARSRTFRVYTPAGFGPDSRLPVLYLLHGSTDSDRDWLELGQAGPLLEHAVRAGSARPMLLVMPDGHPHPSLDVSTRAENLRLLQIELTSVIAPLVETHYHPAPGTAQRAVVGASMGGVQALHLAARAPALFGTVVALSAPADVPGGQTLAEAWRGRPPSAPPVRLLSLCGSADPFLALARDGVGVLRGLGATVEASETAGGHDWATWRAHLTQVLPRLFR